MHSAYLLFLRVILLFLYPECLFLSISPYLREEPKAVWCAKKFVLPNDLKVTLHLYLQSHPFSKRPTTRFSSSSFRPVGDQIPRSSQSFTAPSRFQSPCCPVIQTVIVNPSRRVHNSSIRILCKVCSIRKLDSSMQCPFIILLMNLFISKTNSELLKMY